LLDGRAVHAKGGCRQGYRPLDIAGDTPIHGDPIALARLYTEQCGLDEVYVADLDAISGGREQDAAVCAIAGTGAAVWLDAGVSTIAQARRALDRGVNRVVVGLETMTCFDRLRDITEAATPGSVAFSLDLRNGHPITDSEGLRELRIEVIAARAVEAGAASVIVLDLARVGSDRGIDLGMFETVKRAIPEVTVLAGGGIRGIDDVRHLAELGCDAVLVATALQRPGGADLVRFADSFTRT